jgi:hypothetical protein
LDEFLFQAERQFKIRRIKGDTIQVSKTSLPEKTEIWLMAPERHGFGGPGGPPL